MALPVPSSSDLDSKGNSFFGPNWPFSDPNKPFNPFGPNGTPPLTLPRLPNSTQSKEMDQSFPTGSASQEEVSTTTEGFMPNIGTSPKPGVISGGGAGGGHGSGIYEGGNSEFGPLTPMTLCITAPVLCIG